MQAIRWSPIQPDRVVNPPSRSLCIRLISPNSTLSKLWVAKNGKIDVLLCVSWKRREREAPWLKQTSIGAMLHTPRGSLDPFLLAPSYVSGDPLVIFRYNWDEKSSILHIFQSKSARVEGLWLICGHHTHTSKCELPPNYQLQSPTAE